MLDGVHDEDKPIVKNVIAVVEQLKDKMFKSWSCSVAKGYYVLTVYFHDGDWELSSRELDTIYEVNPLRVTSVCLQSLGQKITLRVKISDRNEPIMLTDTQLVYVRKRSRWV